MFVGDAIVAGTALVLVLTGLAIVRRVVVARAASRRVQRYRELGRVVDWAVVKTASRDAGKLVVLTRDRDAPSVWWIPAARATPEVLHSLHRVQDEGLLVADPPSTSPPCLRKSVPNLEVVINNCVVWYD